VVGKRKDHIKVAEGLARGLSKREAVRQAGYANSTAEKKAYDIVKRPLVQSALTEALERQGVTFDQILKPLGMRNGVWLCYLDCLANRKGAIA